MVNTEFKFEAKNQNSSKVVTFTRSHTKFKGQFDFEGTSQGYQFSNPSETFRCSIYCLSWNIKFQTVQSFKVKTKIFEVPTSSGTFRCSINSSSWKVKFKRVQFYPNFTLKVTVVNFQNCPRHLADQ